MSSVCESRVLTLHYNYAYVCCTGFAAWFETSAKENINIDESARALVNKVSGWREL